MKSYFGRPTFSQVTVSKWHKLSNFWWSTWTELESRAKSSPWSAETCWSSEIRCWPGGRFLQQKAAFQLAIWTKALSKWLSWPFCSPVGSKTVWCWIQPIYSLQVPIGQFVPTTSRWKQPSSMVRLIISNSSSKIWECLQTDLGIQLVDISNGCRCYWELFLNNRI